MGQFDIADANIDRHVRKRVYFVLFGLVTYCVPSLGF
jgi:hypothetical protein